MAQQFLVLPALAEDLPGDLSLHHRQLTPEGSYLMRSSGLWQVLPGVGLHRKQEKHSYS